MALIVLNMGPGFCFEARQKRILIGDEYFFVDLVELKIAHFSHENLGQLKT